MLISGVSFLIITFNWHMVPKTVEIASVNKVDFWIHQRTKKTSFEDRSDVLAHVWSCTWLAYCINIVHFHQSMWGSFSKASLWLTPRVRTRECLQGGVSRCTRLPSDLGDATWSALFITCQIDLMSNMSLQAIFFIKMVMMITGHHPQHSNKVAFYMLSFGVLSLKWLCGKLNKGQHMCSMRNGPLKPRELGMERKNFLRTSW